jgi:nicotinamidase-related amidase
MDVVLEKGRCAVVAVDLQRVFTDPEGPNPNPGTGDLMVAMNRLLAAGREANLPIILSRYVLRDDLRDGGLLRGIEFVEQGHLCVSSKWVAFDTRLEVAPTDIECLRSRPSAFFASDLEAILRSLGVDRIVLSGVSINNAISATARDAFARDIPALVPRECCEKAPFETEQDSEAGYRALATWTAEVADLEDVCARLGALS